MLDVPPLFGVLANDTDADGDPLTVSLLVSTTAGTLVLDADGVGGGDPLEDELRRGGREFERPFRVSIEFRACARCAPESREQAHEVAIPVTAAQRRIHALIGDRQRDRIASVDVCRGPSRAVSGSRDVHSMLVRDPHGIGRGDPFEDNLRGRPGHFVGFRSVEFRGGARGAAEARQHQEILRALRQQQAASGIHRLGEHVDLRTGYLLPVLVHDLQGDDSGRSEASHHDGREKCEAE